jgi:hypothetical protein
MAVAVVVFAVILTVKLDKHSGQPATRSAVYFCGRSPLADVEKECIGEGNHPIAMMRRRGAACACPTPGSAGHSV